MRENSQTFAPHSWEIIVLGNYFAGEDERLWIVFIYKVAQEVWCTYQAHHGKYSAYRSVELGRVDPHALRQICLKKEQCWGASDFTEAPQLTSFHVW